MIFIYINSNPIEDRPSKERKKHDRFNGMPEEEVTKRTLPDHLTNNLDIVIVRFQMFKSKKLNQIND